MRRFPLLIVICALAVFGLAACGGDDNKDSTTAATTEPAATDTTTSDTGAGKTVSESADPGGALKFEQGSLTAPAGKVTFKFTNDSSTPHDFVVESDGQEIAKTEVITESSATADTTLKPGKYTFFCSVPGHRQAGMEGTITVK